MQYIPCNSALLAQEALFLPKKALFMPKDLKKKVRKSRQILIRNKIAYVRAKNFRPSPNFSAGAALATSATQHYPDDFATKEKPGHANFVCIRTSASRKNRSKIISILGLLAKTKTK